ncbi:hypothetical protein [Bacillus paralicheniformis]|uniref:hypothetical protein n=1 Tax=Bacillus paralicheniformis TaxID=1648923 RepID=UPI002DBD9C36|nr:hypothetical protein [Bacillus paralicheniformis]MEC1870689.1 hypothetical protein [Bacillus paralicheniformis]
MELETFSAVATIISAIGTVIAAIATAIAAWSSKKAADEAKKSNQISKLEINKRERPVLDLSTKKFSANLGCDFFSQWDNGDSNHLINQAADFYVDLYNVSDTTARNVVVFFDPVHTREMLENLFDNGFWIDTENNNKVRVSNLANLHLDFTNWDERKVKKFKRLPISPMVETLGSVYPMKYNNEPTKIHLPLYFIYLMNFICTDEDTYKKKPSLKLVLKYSDSFNNKEYVQNIRLTPIFTSIKRQFAKNVEGEGYSFSGRLISEEISNEELKMAE